MTRISEAPGRRVVPWSALSAPARGEGISIAWIGSDGEHWPLTGFMGGTEGAFITGPIDGLVHLPFESIWSKPAYGAPRFERTVDDRKEVTFTLGLRSYAPLGWYDVETRFWRGCRRDATGWLTVTTRRHGQLWIPMQLLEAPKCALPDDPALADCPGGLALHDVVLAADGEPTFKRPDAQPGPFERRAGQPAKGVIRLANRSPRPAWPIYLVSAPGKITLPDGPTSFTSTEPNPLDDWPRISGLFGAASQDAVSGAFTRSRLAESIPVPELQPGEHAIIDTDPTHRIAITVKDPVDNLLKKFLRNTELLEWLLGEYGDSGLPLLQRFHGQGFSVPIPPHSTATLQVSHSRTGGKIWAQLPQRYESALA